MILPVDKILNVISPIEYIGDTEVEISELLPANSDLHNSNSLTWLNDKHLYLVSKIKFGVIICSNNLERSQINSGCGYIIVENPRLAFAKVIDSFFKKTHKPEINTSAKIHKSAVVGKNVGIGHNVIIEPDCIIGDNSSIDHNTVIKSGTVIGNNVKIGCNCTIGGTGFGYEKNENGDYILINHIGNVVLEDYVEVGNNTCIDRAVLGSTTLKVNSKVDNLVHIAHGVELGKNSMAIANSMIAGSTIIGANVWVAPSASVINGIRIDDEAIIGMAAMVKKPVKKGQVIVGNPGRDISERHK